MPPAGERWARVKELFEAAVDLDPNQRSALLARECGEDESLRGEVESLLKSDQQTDGFIEQPAFEIPRDLFPGEVEEPFAGRQFGAYQVIREIGRGGLGAVYLAARADDEYRKEVAIKLIRRGLDTDDILRRFRNERQILAQLDHPNIARLIDGGTTDDGLPYFVMEYVKGAPIGAYCDANALPASERLKLFRKVCATVTYAHQNLVIHRDLKPSNILVTPEGEPKLLDFGIAKLLGPDDELMTQTISGLRVMTPEYASPEQVKGDKITTTSDVYSLGVLLYELLTGQRPYRLKTRTAEEIARAITEQEPERPSTVVGSNQKSEIRNQKSLRGDLDNIVLMAMRKEPTRRYASVGQFSEDVRRHLDGLPVLARKDTARYRTEKFIQRHKVGVAAAALIALTLIGGLIATFWQANRATRQAKLAAQERDRAQRRFEDVRHLSNALLFEIAPKMERLEGSTEARAALVRRALEYLDSLARESVDDAQLQRELATAYEKVGELQGAPRKPNLNDFPGAVTSYEKARRIREHLLSKNPDDVENLRRFAANLSALSVIRRTVSDVSGSLGNSQKALEVYDKLLSAAASPAPLDLRLAAAESRLDLATTHYYAEELPKVYAPLKQALASLETVRQTDLENSEILRLLGRGYTLLGMTLSWDSKQEEGEAEMAKALTINEALNAKFPQDNVLTQALLETYLQSSQLYEDADPARSFEILLKTRVLAEQSIKADPSNRQARLNLAKTYSRLGVIALNLKKQNEATGYLEQSLDAFAELAKSDSNNRAYTHDMGRVLMFLGQTRHQKREFPEALASYAKAATLFEEDARADPENNFPIRKLATVHTYVGDTHQALAETVNGEEQQGHVKAAQEHYHQALDILLRLEAQNALTTYDRQYLEQLKTIVQKYEKE